MTLAQHPPPQAGHYKNMRTQPSHYIVIITQFLLTTEIHTILLLRREISHSQLTTDSENQSNTPLGCD